MYIACQRETGQTFKFKEKQVTDRYANTIIHVNKKFVCRLSKWLSL